MPRKTASDTRIWQRLRYMSMRPKLIYGRKANERKKPDKKPQMWAKLSIHGSNPKAKRNRTTHSSLANARHGCARICQLWKSSTNRHAKIPNCEPAGPTCADTNRNRVSRNVQNTYLVYIIKYKLINNIFVRISGNSTCSAITEVYVRIGSLRDKIMQMWYTR